MKARLCAHVDCSRVVSDERRAVGAKFCSTECRVKAQNRKLTEQYRQRRGEAEAAPSASGLLAKLTESGDADRIDRKALSVKEASAIHDVTSGAVTKAMDGWYAAKRIERENEGWGRGPLVQAMLPVDKLLRVRALGADAEGEPEFEALIDELVRAFDVFGRYYFRLEGNRPIHKDFHLAWIRLILVAYATGGKQMILSPPRHGKSELMIRFVTWLIVMFPNIRIGWFCAAKDVAGLMLGAVKDHLVNNELLIRATLPPGDTFKPPTKDGKPWSAKEFKVKQQDHVGQKSSSMLALGVTSKFLSRDMDLIVVDDMEDFDSTREPSSRRYAKAKLAEIGTRKEEHTAEIITASRQHPDDIPSAVMKLKGTQQAWRVRVDSAHDESCGLDPDDYEAHVDCMLFPEIRSYRWLMEKKVDMESLGIPGAYEMRYLNRPIPTEGIVFNVPRIRDKALNRSRVVGIEGLGAGRLVAGLDPASRGMQAAYAWHFNPGALSMVDLETQKAGGHAGALRVMEDWARRFGLLDWYYEDNSQQTEFFQDPRVRELKREWGITITPHTTGKNKQDPELGISSMAPWYHDGTIDLPYGDPESREKVNMLLRQLELWTTDGVQSTSKNQLTDIKMASWFPFPRIVRWNRKATRQDQVNRGDEQSYPSVHRGNAVPWQTRYPKGR